MKCRFPFLCPRYSVVPLLAKLSGAAYAKASFRTTDVKTSFTQHETVYLVGNAQIQ